MLLLVHRKLLRLLRGQSRRSRQSWSGRRALLQSPACTLGSHQLPSLASYLELAAAMSLWGGLHPYQMVSVRCGELLCLGPCASFPLAADIAIHISLGLSHMPPTVLCHCCEGLSR